MKPCLRGFYKEPVVDGRRAGTLDLNQETAQSAEIKDLGSHTAVEGLNYLLLFSFLEESFKNKPPVLGM